MTVSISPIEERRELRNNLQAVVEEEVEAAAIPLAIARALHAANVNQTVKRAGVGFVRDWADYANEHGVTDDPFAIRYHVTQFAAERLGKEQTSEHLQEVDIADVHTEGTSYADILSAHTSPAVLTDPHVAITGGAARLALKMYAGVDTHPELPISDIDAVISTDSGDIAARAAAYGIDLNGAKIIDEDMRTALEAMVTNVDCTMNQVAIYNGKLLFSERALADVREGNIRLVAKNDPLFGSEGIVLPSGDVYVNRVGFYRGLSFLLRGKGDQLVVSQENIDREVESIGRYWQIMLAVKLLPMKNEAARYQAIGQWHELARQLGATETTGPLDFLAELTEAYPDSYAGKKREFNASAQARWLIGKLVNQAVLRMYERDTFDPPETYTPANIRRPNYFTPYDFAAFMATAKDIR